MIPLRAEKRFAGLSLAVWAVAALCLAALARLSWLSDTRALPIIDALAVVPRRLLAAPSDPAQLITLVSGIFLHAGWIHLLSNLLFLLVFGPAVQARLGWRGFLGLYLASGVAGALAFAITHPQSTAPLLGASGAIAGVLGAHLVLEPRARITTLVPVFVMFEIASLPAAFVIAVWFVLQIASNVAPVVPQSGTNSIAWIAHIAGFVTGLVLATPLGVRSGLAARRRGTSSANSRSKRRAD